MNFLFNQNLWYVIYLAVLGFFYVQSRNKYLQTTEGLTIKEQEDYRANVLFAILAFLPLIIIAGTRDQFSVGDTGLYVSIFNDYPTSMSELGDYITWNEKDTGFIIFSTFIRQFLGTDYHTWLMIIAVISGSALLFAYRRYTPDFIWCAFLFFISTDFMSWMMNGMRQFMVVAIVFALFPFIQRRKYIPFIVCVFFLYFIHHSALLVLPLYVFALGKPFNKKTTIILLLCLLAILFVEQFTGLLDDSLQSTAYKNVVSEFDTDDGTNIFRAFVYAVPTVIAFIFRKKFNDDTPEIINISVNMSVISTGLYLLSVFTSGVYMGRLPIYFSLFNYILLPWEIKNLFPKGNTRTIFAIMIILYFVFFFYQMNVWEA